MNKTIEIGKPFDPSKVIDFYDEIGFSILYSYGGGMGGANSTMYTNKSKPDISKEFVDITDIYGVVHTLNTRFIVRISPVTIAYLVIENCGNLNFGKEGDRTRYIYASSILDKFELTKKYVSSDKLKPYFVGEHAF